MKLSRQQVTQILDNLSLSLGPPQSNESIIEPPESVQDAKGEGIEHTDPGGYLSEKAPAAMSATDSGRSNMSMPRMWCEYCQMYHAIGTHIVPYPPYAPPYTFDTVMEAGTGGTVGRLPAGQEERQEYPMWDGLMAYFPDALAEVARLSHKATQQHHPDQPMHWDREKSLNHKDKIIKHLMDNDLEDTDQTIHAVKAAWRALANAQETLERVKNLPPSPASKGKRYWEK